MRVTEVLPQSGESSDAATAEGRAWLADRYRRAPGPHVRLNMVTTLTGAASGGDGTSDSLTNRTDRTILGVIRREADVVVVGAESVRAEGYIVPRAATLAILSRSGRLEGHRLARADLERVLLVVPEAADVTAPEGVGVLRIAGARDLSPAAVIAALADRGLTRVVCEGGPSVASQFAAAGVVDEFCITVAPRLTPAERPFLALADTREVEPAGMLVDEAGFSYLRLRPRPAGEATA